MNVRESIAFHEAGHGVIGIVHGLPIARIAISSDPDAFRAGGFVIVSPIALSITTAEALMRDRPPTSERPLRIADLHAPLLAHALYLAAGGAAERKYRADGRCGDWDDRRKLEHLLAEAFKTKPYGRTVELAEAVIMAYADRAVTTHWDWIRRVAAELVEHGTLDGARAAALRREKEEAA